MPTKFDFLSPGIELREIDQSAVAAVPENDGLLLIGRAKKGPAMKPIKITSLADFQSVFGTPMDGVKRGDPWREGNTGGGGWAAYAAEAYLAAEVGPVKFIRLAGVEESAGDAGWSVTQNTYPIPPGSEADVAGAIGIFVAEDNAGVSASGVLAAILYTSGSNLVLSGVDQTTAGVTDKTATAVVKTPSGWAASLQNGTPNQDFDFTFNFDPNSQNFIRNVLTTDAVGFDPSTPAAAWNNHHVFLGESFENNVGRLSGDLIAWTAGITIDNSNKHFTNHNSQLSEAKTGWFIGSAASSYKRLFRLAALDEGSDFHKTHIVRIKDLRKATTVRPEGSFTIEIARAGQRPAEYVEKFVNVTLNPDSPNYILKKIGDLKQEWNSTSGKIVSTGSFNNESNLIRVELAEGGVNKTDLPLGFLGPAKIADVEVPIPGTPTAFDEWMYGEQQLPSGIGPGLVMGLSALSTITVTWPTHGLSIEDSAANGANYAPSAIHGLSYEAQRGNEDFADIGLLKSDYDPHLAYTAAATEAAYTFSLEHIDEDSTVAGTYYHTNAFVEAFDSTTVGNEGALALGIKQFAAPFFGGTDGVDIKVENPFNNDALTNTAYAKYSMESAISQVADYYTSRYDLISIPGVTNSSIISSLVRQTEERGDALAIIDMNGIYVSEVDNDGSTESPGSVATMVSTAEGGTVASSYAAAYYPNVRIADVSSGRGSVLMAPPSVAAIGAIAKSEALSQPWFAPAGFTRGGLAPLGGNGGANVVGTLEHLSKADRDDLYNVNINPIARFPATGDTVIFGQKTLQPTDTALDRINVRRMMIYLKKRIGGIADQFLFEQGVKATYDRFKATIEPILSEVRSQYGITEYKVVLDETTTTPDLQDRNIMYAKVFVKPAKAIEYVVIDFVVTQSGVEF
jgi:hypothetical protein